MTVTRESDLQISRATSGIGAASRTSGALLGRARSAITGRANSEISAVRATADQLEYEGEQAVQFQPSLCAVLGLPTGGGSTFECYTSGIYQDGTLELAGTGFAAVYTYAPPTLQGDIFDDQADGVLAGGAPEDSATGLTTIFVG